MKIGFASVEGASDENFVIWEATKLKNENNIPFCVSLVKICHLVLEHDFVT